MPYYFYYYFYYYDADWSGEAAEERVAAERSDGTSRGGATVQFTHPRSRI